MTPKDTLKNWFVTGAKPTQEQFWAWLDSYWHKDEKIPLSTLDGLNDVLTDKADKELVDTIYKELLSAIDNIDLTKIIDDESDKANDKVYSINKIKELIESIKFINDELESSKDLTYSVDKIKEFVNNKINTINFSEVIDDDEQDSDKLTYSINKIKALLQTLSDGIKSEYVKAIFAIIKTQAPNIYSNGINQADIFPEDMKPGDIYIIYGIDGKPSIIYEYNGCEWVIKYDFNYNFIVELGADSNIEDFSTPNNIITKLGFPLGTEVTTFKHDHKTNTIYVGIKLVSETYIRGLDLFNYKKIIYIDKNEFPISKISIDGSQYKDSKIIDFIGYKYLETLFIANSLLESDNIVLDSILLHDNPKLSNISIINYMKIGDMDLKNIGTDIDSPEKIEIGTETVKISIVNDEETYWNTVNLYYMSANPSIKKMESLTIDNIYTTDFLLGNYDLTDLPALSLPGLKPRKNMRDNTAYSIMFMYIIITEAQLEEIVSWLLGAEFRQDKGYVYFTSINQVLSDEQIKNLQDKGYTVVIS